MSESVIPTQPVAEKPRKKKRIFMWVFLAVQALFLIWIITGVHSGHTSATDCGTLSQSTCQGAADVGTAIGAALVIALWCVVDFLLGMGYLIYRLAKRP